VILTANRDFRKAENKKFRSVLKEAKKDRTEKAKQYDRENSPGQNGEDF
jgi:hypothetical protein